VSLTAYPDSTFSNADIAELLCRASEESARPYQQRRALKRAGRAALRWPEEAADLIAAHRALTELRFVGPWLAQMIREWCTDPPEIVEAPPVRRDFLTRTDVTRILTNHPRASRVRCDLQMHTSASDGSAPLHEMAEAALARGCEYIAITDHSKGLAIANGMNEEQLAHQGEAIVRLNEGLSKRNFRILRAVEMNLSPNGRGDLDPVFLSTLDLVLGAFHSRLRLGADQTERYLAAFEHPQFHVLAHPRGRIFNFRLGLIADWERVFERAREMDRAIEIDGFPDRQDLNVGPAGARA
jgi:histidinol phosphatase-like PHP family hydrolase